MEAVMEVAILPAIGWDAGWGNGGGVPNAGGITCFCQSQLRDNVIIDLRDQLIDHLGNRFIYQSKRVLISR